MRKPMAAGGIAVAAVALGLVLTGCGSDTKSEATSSAETTAEATSTTGEAPTTSANASGDNYTIVDYIRDNRIVETPVHRGDPGTPTVNLPFPAGLGGRWGAHPVVGMERVDLHRLGDGCGPPTIIALMSKLTGNVDPAKILEFAPGEIKNLPGYENQGDGSKSTLGGFEAFQIFGTYVKDGAKRLIAQKTVVIPEQGGPYVLQLNADGLENQMGPLMDATAVIDEQTTITP